MADWPMQSLFLGRRRRRRRRDLGLFLQALGGMLYAGFDLAYAWPRTWADLERELGEESRRVLVFEGGGFAGFLQVLGEEYPDPGHRLWFQVLCELYGTGAPLTPTLNAFTQALAQEQERDWQAHLRGLPLKVSLILAVFFLGPALALVFVPMLAEMAETFR
jgi:hypothetical protein